MRIPELEYLKVANTIPANRNVMHIHLADFFQIAQLDPGSVFTTSWSQ
jgi:hypothetical protein